jgi:hypothetical protein
MQPVDPTAAIAITLQAQEWNMILGVLHDAPYRIAAPLIQKIGDQAQSAAAQPPAKPNGVDDHVPH